MPILITKLKKLVKKIDTMPLRVQKEVSAALKEGAYEINAQAIKNIKANDSIGVSGGGGGLLGSQQVTAITDGKVRGYRVQNTAPYAPFVEFGTGSRVNVPADWSKYAQQFRGRKISPGGIDDFLLSIVMWVRAKGLSGTRSAKGRRKGNSISQQEEDLAVAYPIFLSILRNGSKPHPFLYPAYIMIVSRIIKDVKASVRKALK